MNYTKFAHRLPNTIRALMAKGVFFQRAPIAKVTFYFVIARHINRSSLSRRAKNASEKEERKRLYHNVARVQEIYFFQKKKKLTKK